MAWHGMQMGCEKGCKPGNQTCQVICELTHPSTAFDTMSACLVKNGCMSREPSPPCPVLPSPVDAFDIAHDLVGGWWVLRGLSPTFDCFQCQSMVFHPMAGRHGGGGLTALLRGAPAAVASPRAGAGADEELFYNYTMRVEPGLEHTVNCSVAQNRTTPGVMTVRYETAGLPGTDHWVLLARDSASPPNWLFLHYCGASPAFTCE